MKKKLIHSVLFLILIFSKNSINAQCLTLGADLSYVNTVEANGAIFKNENGDLVDPYEYFAEQGANMVRMRLWHTPENITDVCGNPISTNNLNDVINAFKKAKAAGMQLKLAIHYGDYFNDPGKQKMPAAWVGLPHEILLDSIYEYTLNVLNKLNAENILPDIVAVGNETTWGFVDATAQTDGWQWPQDAQKFNTGLTAVDDFNSGNNTSIKKAIHFTDKTAEWLAGLFQENNVTNFDIIGVSFYPIWTEFNTMGELGELIAHLKSTYDKEVMIFETGAPWTNSGADNYNNIMSDYGNLNYPVTPQGHKDFLFDLAQVVYENGGTGILYWEPAWVTSGMCDLWGQGSSYENVSFFDFKNDNKPLPAFDFFDFCKTLNNTETTDSIKINIYPNPNNKREITIESESQFTTWQLCDLNGKLVEKGEVVFNIIILAEKMEGLFVLKLKTDKGKQIIEKIKLAN